MIQPKPSDTDDRTEDQFLAILARDIHEHPERLQPIDANLQQRVNDLIHGVDLDLDAPLSASVD